MNVLISIIYDEQISQKNSYLNSTSNSIFRRSAYISTHQLHCIHSSEFLYGTIKYFAKNIN